MSAFERVTVTLPADLAAAMRATVAGGDYASESDIVREALDDWTRTREQEQRDAEALREAVRIGDESGPGLPAEEVFDEMRRLIAERRAGR